MEIKLQKITVRELTAGYQDNEENGVVAYGGKLDVRPPYQREFVYKDNQRNAVIDTLRQNFPLNVMYWAVRSDGTFEIIDGQQRTISICQYVNGDFAFDFKYFHNLQKDEKEQILDYELNIYICSGTDSEKLKWFKTINISGEKLTEQELRNAVYSGSWVADAKRYFSKNNCAAYGLASKYINGSPIRQDYLETAIDWISKGDIEDYMGDSYAWVQGDGDLVGYFTTTPKTASNQGSDTMKVTTGTYGRISRRQIYQSTESESAVVGDMLMVLSGHINTSPSIQLQTLRPMSFGGGSISLGGTAWMGAEPLQQEKNKYTIRMRLGIGMTRASAKWWYMATETVGATPTISSGWSSTPSIFNVPLSGNTLKSTGTYFTIFIGGSIYIYPAIPVPEDTYGYIFIDIMGAHDYTNGNEIDAFEIANLEISYSRDSYQIPSSIGEVRPRELITKRVTSQEYSAVNSNASKDEWNANCIFASDNNMEYGYGLLLNSSGNIIQTVQYGGSATNQQHPEQHLATRVANYWATAKRKIDPELLTNKIPAVDPTNIVKVGTDTVTTYAPIAISRDWRDDTTRLSLLQL